MALYIITLICLALCVLSVASAKNAHKRITELIALVFSLESVIKSVQTVQGTQHQINDVALDTDKVLSERMDLLEQRLNDIEQRG